MDNLSTELIAQRKKEILSKIKFIQGEITRFNNYKCTELFTHWGKSENLEKNRTALNSLMGELAILESVTKLLPDEKTTCILCEKVIEEVQFSPDNPLLSFYCGECKKFFRHC